MQKLAPNKRETSILAVLRFEKLSKEMFFDLIRLVLFEKRLSFVRVYWNTILVSRQSMAPHVNDSSKEMRRLISK